MLKRLGFIAVVLSLVFAASMASADNVYLAEVGVSPPTNVNIYADGLGNVSTQAGNYLVNIKTSLAGTPTQYRSFCVEPAISSTAYQVYELRSIANGSEFEAAAWVLSQNFADAAAAQVAVWELTWDWGTAYDLSAGNFRLNSGPINTTTVAAIYNAALAGVASFDQSGYMLAVSPVGSTTWENYQNFIVPVPLPPTALLLGSGLLGIVTLGWRRRRQNG